MKKRAIGKELLLGLKDIEAHYSEKITLRTHRVDQRLPKVTGAEVRRIREELRMSQAVFAHLIGTPTKTLQRWERELRHAISSPAGILVRLIQRRPDMVREIEVIYQ
jgi:putative transcriptional regulator